VMPRHLQLGAAHARIRARPPAAEPVAPSSTSYGRIVRDLPAFVKPTSRAHAWVQKVRKSAGPAVLRRIES